MHHRRMVRVIGREGEIEEEESVVVRRAGGADYDGAKEIDPVLVNPDEYGFG